MYFCAIQSICYVYLVYIQANRKSLNMQKVFLDLNCA